MTLLTAADGSTIDIPDVHSLAGTNMGVRGVWRYHSGRAGPHVVISALMHGNEVCGAVALAPLLRSPPRIAHGTLTLAFCNLDAFARVEDATKGTCRQVDEDMNRVWGRLDANDSCESRRAREIAPFLDEADVLLDIHSMTLSAPALALVGQAEKNMAFAQRLGLPLVILRDAGHEAGLRLIDRPQFVNNNGHPTAMLLECGAHFELSSCSVAAEAVRRTIYLYLQGGSLPPLSTPLVLQATDRVTIDSADFRFVRTFRNLECIADAGTPIAFDGDQIVRTTYPNAYLLMPATPDQIKPGQTAVRFARQISGPALRS